MLLLFLKKSNIVNDHGFGMVEPLFDTQHNEEEHLSSASLHI